MKLFLEKYSTLLLLLLFLLLQAVFVSAANDNLKQLVAKMIP
ncbi:MAG: hypothetical protein RR397_05990 [Odoribacter sp.]